MSDHTETTLPCLTFTAVVPGEVTALCRLVIDEDQGKDQLTAIAAARVANYDADPPAAVFWQAESLTPVAAGAAVVTSSLPSNTSGTGAILANALTTTWQDILKSTVVSSALTSVTGTASTDVFTKTSHGMVNGASVLLSSLSGGTGLSTSTTYYVINRAANTFQLSATPGGAAVDFTTNVTSVSVTATTYWTHTGRYRVLARCQPKSTNTGDVQVRASWGLGDLALYSQGSARSISLGAWTLADLGVINIPSSASRWEFRLQSLSSVNGDAVYADCLFLPCADEASGTAQVTTTNVATTQTISDTFTRSSVSLDADTPSPQTDGNNWVESTATSFTVNGTQAQRTGTGDSAGANNGKFAAVGAATAGQYAQLDLTYSVAPGAAGSNGVLLRYTDTSNWAAAIIYGAATSGFGLPRILKCVAGTVTGIAIPTTGYITLTAGATYTLQAAAYANGRVDLHVYANGALLSSVSVTDTALATGGTLASGKIGIIDHYTSGTACTRTYEYLVGGTSLSNAACYASQSVEFSSSGWRREDASGVVWGNPGNKEGDPLLVPPGPAEIFIKLSRALIGEGGDDGIDDLSCRMFAVPRGLLLPS